MLVLRAGSKKSGFVLKVLKLKRTVITMKPDEARFIALGSRLRGVPEVHTLGVKPNFLDYAMEDRHRILNAEIILYPTLNYAQLLTTLGKKIFPSLETYLYADEKIKQTTLFQMLGLQHPRTKMYFRLHHGDILNDFDFPFIAKVPRASSRGKGVFKIENKEELRAYLMQNNVAYIQEYLPHERDLRVVLIDYEPVLAYWRVRAPDSFKTNLSQGGLIRFEGIPERGVTLAREYAQKCKFNDVGLDFIEYDDKWFLIEANMKYGRKGLKMRGMNLKEILRAKLLSGSLLIENH